jgi:hypothetical protein
MIQATASPATGRTRYSSQAPMLIVINAQLN